MEAFETPVPDLASTLTTQVGDINPDLLRSQPTIARRMRAAINSSRESIRLARDRRTTREASGQERLGPEWGLPPRVIYDSAFAGELRHARDGLHDWVTQIPLGHNVPGGGRGSRPELSTGSPDAPSRSSATVPGLQSSELRSGALSQALRRHSRMSPRTRIGLESYMLEGARRTDEGETEPSRHARLLRPPSMINPGERRQGIPTSELRSSVEAYRQRYLHNPTGEHAEAAGPLDEAIKYLDRVRSSDSIEESTLVAHASEIMNQLSTHVPFPLNGHEDLVIETRSIPPPRKRHGYGSEAFLKVLSTQPARPVRCEEDYRLHLRPA